MVSRVGILTLPLYNNYGGILQAAALYEYISSLGYHVVRIERYDKETIKRKYTRVISRYMPDKLLKSLAKIIKNEKLSNFLILTSNHRFIRKFLPIRSGFLFSSKDVQEAIIKFDLDAVVVGSDQVWRPDYLPPESLFDFFLGSAEATRARRISYAASFGHSGWRHPEHTTQVSNLLSRFDAISVREASGVDICRNVFGRGDAVHVLDPTLLVDPAFYNRLAEAPNVRTNSVLFEYILDRDGAEPTIGEEVAASLWDHYSVQSVTLDSKEALPGIGGWLRSIMDADFVMTDSFHGMVFSIIFQKNFIAVVNHKRGADRFTSLVSLLGLEDRLIDRTSKSQAFEIAARPIDYSSVAIKLETLRERSQAFLRTALN